MTIQNQKQISVDFKLLLGQLFKFEPVREYSDEIWQFYTPPFKRGGKWLYQSFVKYQDTVYWTINSDAQYEFNLTKETLKEGQHQAVNYEEN